MKNDNDSFIMLPTVDFCFKELMQNTKVRKGFISALLGVSPDSVEDTELMPTSLYGNYPDEKLGILDVRVRLMDGKQMDLEMQVASFSCWENRIIFYLARMYVDQLKIGDPYGSLQKCIHVSILDFIHFPEDDECYRTITLRDNKTGKLYSDLLEIKILELKKLKGNPLPGDADVYEWMRFFSGKTREDFKTMASTNEYIGEAYSTLVHMSEDERKKIEYDARFKALCDYNTQMKSNYDQGITYGLEKGAEKKLLDLISRKLEKGQSVEQIAEALEESPEYIEKMVDRIRQKEMSASSVPD